jgi:hypothetical protein
VARGGGGGKPRAFSASFLSSASATDFGTSWGSPELGNVTAAHARSLR